METLSNSGTNGKISLADYSELTNLYQSRGKQSSLIGRLFLDGENFYYSLPILYSYIYALAPRSTLVTLSFSSFLPGIQEHVLKLRKISNEVFQLLVKLRRPSDPLGTRFNTICHGDMWMGNLMFKDDVSECVIIDFHSAQFLSPATDLAHLLLTSTSRAYRQEVSALLCRECTIAQLSLHTLLLEIFQKINRLRGLQNNSHLTISSAHYPHFPEPTLSEHEFMVHFMFQKWDEVVEIYYDTFNRTLAEFGLILRHLGTTYQDFLYEVKRALRGQFLCVAFIIPIGESE